MSASLDWLHGLTALGIVPGLERIDALCRRLGRPERSTPSLLVAGTNGKGSTIAMLDSILLASERRTGLYTSPHLVRLNERFRIAGEDVDDAALVRALDAIRTAAAATPAIQPSYFEALTAAAFLLFAERRLDLWLLEVGLGGRWDATNLAPAEVAVITPIALDHTDLLGDRIAAIAGEKAGIIKPGRPVIVAPQTAEAMAVITDEAERQGSRLIAVEAADAFDIRSTPDGTTFRIRTASGEHELTTPLAGAHQAINALTAVRAAETLGLSIDSIAIGLSGTRWPGRLERRFDGARDWIFDAAHNPHGAEALAEHLDRAGLAGTFVLLLGVLADKDAAGICRPLVARAASAVFATPPGPRGLPASDLARIAGRAAVAVADLDAAIAATRAQAGSAVVVAGSILFVGEILARWDDKIVRR